MTNLKHPDLPYYRSGLMSSVEAAFHLEITISQFEKYRLENLFNAFDMTYATNGCTIPILWFKKEDIHFIYKKMHKPSWEKRSYKDLKDIR